MKKLVIIDKNPFLLCCLSDFLGMQFHVQTADDEFKGIKLIQAFQPDLILCDLKLPNLDGYQVLKSVRENVKTAKTPLVFLSCLSAWEEGDRALQLGANDYLSKPVRLRKLLSTIEGQLESKDQKIRQM